MKKAIAMTVCAVALAVTGRAAEAGKPAPDFTAQSTKGEVKLADYKGKWLALYFYPKSFTPGCTKESCSLRDGFEDLKKAGVEILGVSLDDVEKQKKFKAEYKLPFELIADTDKKVAKAYDALMVGGLMAKRLTFLIDPEGNLAKIVDGVDTADHDGQVLKEIEALKTARK